MAEGVRAVLVFIGRSGKRVAVTLIGAALLVAGLVMMVAPGPGLLVVLAGFAVLATEYVWAQRALDVARRKASRTRDKFRHRGDLRRALRRGRPGAGEEDVPPGSS